MEASNSPNQREDSLQNSTTISVDVQFVEDNSNSSPSQEDSDLKGSFTVNPSSNELLENVNDNELDKSLTLVVCRPSGGSPINVDSDDVTITGTKESGENEDGNEIKKFEQSSEDLEAKKEETPPVCSEDIEIITTEPVNVDDRKDNMSEESDTKQMIKRKASGKTNSPNSNKNKSLRKVVELDETVEVNEPVERNNKEESGRGRESVTSSHTTRRLSNPAPAPVDNSKERKYSTGEVVSKNKSPLSLDSPAKGTRSSRRDAQTTPINRKENRLPSIINTDDRTSNNKKCNRRNSGCGNSNGKGTNTNVNSVNRTRSHSSHGERGRRNTKLYHRNSAVSRSYDKSVNILGSHSSLESSERHRPVSVFEQRYTTRELRKALPRRSFFSCHERAMKDAGFETDDPEKKLKAERLKARLERIANEFSPLPSARNKLDSNANQELVNGVVNITINDGGYDLVDKVENEIDTVVSNMNSDIGDASKSTTTDNSSSKHDASKLLVKPTHKKRPGSARQEHIECKPLLQYLEYVKDNRDEYLHHSHTNVSQSHMKSSPVSRLISLGKAFELRHLGGVPRRHDDDIIVMAAKALRPRCSDSAKYTKIDRDRSGTHRGQDSLRQARPASEDKRKQESHAKEDDHAKTEMERKRIRAEEWTKSVSTNTLTKAKVQSLRELGADDNEIMKWWDAFKSCRYLRDTGPVEEKVS